MLHQVLFVETLMVSLNAVKCIFISQMKRQGIKCCSNGIQEGAHQFHLSLRAIIPNPKQKIDLFINFGSQLTINQSEISNNNANKQDSFDLSILLPTFSTGASSKFNAFVGTSQKEAFDKQNKELLQKLYRESQLVQTSNFEMIEAQPKSTYCQICKETFSDYLKHLNHPVHVKKFESQRKNSMIDDLIKGLDAESRPFRRNKRSASEEEQLESQRMPCKIRVIQTQNTLTPMRLTSNLSKNCSSMPKSAWNAV